VGLREVTLGILRLLLLIVQLGRLENLICKTLELVAISGLLLSLGVENANGIQEAFKFAWPWMVLFMMMRLFYCVDRTIRLSLLVVALG
jgi:predicted benzoate:H+ symporter BenE